jgi:hypothetical protein
LFALGFCGRPHSHALRQALLKELALPSYLSTARLLHFINTALTCEEWEKAVRAVTEEKTP